MLGLSAVDLVNGHRGVDDFRLNSFLVNDGLDVLMKKLRTRRQP
jgi:hypothetical protein